MYLRQGCGLALEKVEGVFTNPPPLLPRAGPDLTADFSQDLHSDITSYLEGFGTVKSGKNIVHVHSCTVSLYIICMRVCVL